MANDELCWHSAVELAAGIRQRTISPVDVIEAVLAQIERLNPELNAYCTVTADAAVLAAKDAERAAGARDAELGPLHGVPVSLKDMILTKGVRTTFGSKLYADFVPEEDPPVVERLQAAGAILVGKTNTPDHGWLGVTHNRLFGATRNPWDPSRTPGGSSGGAGAAVAAGMAPLAVGTDSGGSIRIPASLSGVFGFKAHLGRVPVSPFSPGWSLAHAGPMSRTVSDAALLLNVLSGPDDRDAQSLPDQGIDFMDGLDGSLEGLRVAWSGTFGYLPVEREVLAICERAAGRFEELGCTVEADDPEWPDPREAWMTTFLGGAATRLAPALAERRDDLDPGFASLLDRVAEWTPTTYVEAWLERLSFVDSVRRFFERYDILLSPTVACAAFDVGLSEPTTIAGVEQPMYQWIGLTFPFNLTGQPAASVPCGFTSDNLPVGLQIVGRRFQEATVLRAAARFEEAQPWADRRPPVS